MAKAAQPILTIEQVDIAYGALQVVHGVDMHVGPRELVGLVGGNGSGKSTILRAISGMVRHTRGHITFNGKNVDRLKPHAMARLGFAHIPMGRHLFGNLSVYENLLLGSTDPRARQHRVRNLDRVYHLFPELTGLSARKAVTLSGGQQQMVAIGRALMMEPKMLAMDEPSLGLSPKYVKQTMHAIRQIAKDGVPILLVEQNVRRVLQHSDRAYVLENGRMIVSGRSRDLMEDERVRKAYLGM